MDRKKLGKPFLASFCWSEDKPTILCTMYHIHPVCGRHRWVSPSRGEFANQCSTLTTGRNKTRADGWRGVLMDMAWTMHSRGVRGLTMKKFSHEKRASAESCECSEGSRLFHRVGGFIDHHRARNRVGRRRISEPQHRLLIMYGDDYTIEQKD